MGKVSNAVELEKTNPDLVDKWLTFWLDGQLYGASIVHVEQIVSMMPVTPVPEYPVYAKGVINIRGSIIPLIDLRLRLGKPEAEYTDQTCVIICNIDGHLIGFIADSVDAVLTIPESAVSAPPRMHEGRKGDYLTGIARLVAEDGGQDKLVLCLDTQKVLLEGDLDVLVQE